MTPEEIITAGGGRYRGPMREDSIGLHMELFDSPTTGSTLAITFDKLTVENVRQHIDEHNAKWFKTNENIRKGAANDMLHLQSTDTN